MANAHCITPDTKTQAVLWLWLRQALCERSLADLARALGTRWAHYRQARWGARHWASLKTLDKAARMLGKRLELRFA